MRPLRHWVAAPVLAAVLVAILPGCSSLPPPAPREPSLHLADTRDTVLGRAVAASDPGNGSSGQRPLADPLDAFAARVLLIRSAERSLDVQYYIWHDDITGRLLLAELQRAAERGVRVRLLLDDNGIAGMDGMLAALDAHPRVEVRLFNPFVHRRFKVLGYLTEFRRLNHRMHNKALIADTQAMIVGGRNVGDAYFGADPALEFSDLDVLAAGPVAAAAATSFDAYWNHPLTYELTALVQPPSADAPLQPPDLSDPAVARYLQAVEASPLAIERTGGRLELEWVPMRLLADPPDKAAGKADPSQLLAARLGVALGTARREIDLVSAYLVPGRTGTAALVRYPRDGVRLRLVTNSLAATDVAAVHAGYARRRVELLRAGVQLHEIKPDAGAARARRALDWRWPDSAASLHGKTFAVDRERAFVGSFNLDPRSLRLNTEMGLVIESPALARSIAEGLDQRLSSEAYALRLGVDGELEWVEQTPSGVVVHRDEPQAGFWRRLGVLLMSWLPIEWLL